MSGARLGWRGVWFAAVLALGGCEPASDRTFQGWVEADLVFVAADEIGRVEKLVVRDGDTVTVGAPLFTLDAELQQADVNAGKAAAAEARARLARAQAEQQRPAEIAVLEAQEKRAQAMLALSTAELERQKQLAVKGIASKAQLDTAEANYARDRAALEEIGRQIKVAHLSGREEDIAAARHALAAAEARLASAQTRLERRTIASPVGGSVQRIYFRPGEMAPIGRPVWRYFRRRTSSCAFLFRSHAYPTSRWAIPRRCGATVAKARSRRASISFRVVRNIHRRSFLLRRNAPSSSFWSKLGRCIRNDCASASRCGSPSRRRRRSGEPRARHRYRGGGGGRTVVRDLSMQVRRGAIYGFLGPNGSGKTTTIRMLCGLLTPDAGRGTTLGFDIRTQAGEIKRRVGYMTQRFSLYQDLSVRENLEFVARLYGVPDPVGTARAMIERLGLDGRGEQLAGSLSGGWKQRLALGACTLPNPQLLLLDEPTAGVDPKARREFWNEIHTLAADGLTVLVSTHYMDEAERCHEIAYIAYGVLLTHGTVKEVIARSGLVTYTASGGDIAHLTAELGTRAGVDMVAPFGTSLHVSGRDPETLEAAIVPYREDPTICWTRGEPSLEDVFIELMSRAQDNFQ